jgi:hypothetical protein
MTERIRVLLNAFPFLPFSVETASGRSYRVNHPDFGLIDPDSSEIVIEELDGLTQFLNHLLITAVEYQPIRS